MADVEDLALSSEARDDCTLVNCFRLPGSAGRGTIRADARRAGIGSRADVALHAVETDDPRLGRILDKRFGGGQQEPGKLSKPDAAKSQPPMCRAIDMMESAP